VRDARSPSGWRFRTSWSAAANAYIRAATLAQPTNRALTFSMLSNLLPTTVTQIRIGRAAEGSPQSFAAHPSIDGDSVVFFPHSFSDVMAVKPGVVSTSLPEALRRNRDVLVLFARRWSASFPDNPDAFEALAAGHEARGEIGADGEGAGVALQKARALARTPDERVRLAAFDVRLRIKRGEFESAVTLADSLLDARASVPSVAQASRLAGLAALTGRATLEGSLRDLATTSGNADEGIAPQVTSVASRLFARAATGACDDSVLVLRGQLDTLLESYSQPIRRPALRRALITRPMSLVYPCFGPRVFAGVPTGLPLDIAQRAAGAGDRRRAAGILDSLEAVRRVAVPGEISLDFVLQESRLRAAIGDTAKAIAELDRVLRALPTLSPFAVREEAQSAALARSLAFRAELARARGDSAEQQLRARQALTLWRHADPWLAPSLERLRSLASPVR
jgi:hypothetical protein